MNKAIIGFAQFHPVFGDREANIAAISRLVGVAKDADLLVFPELAVSGYDFRDRDELASLAEPFNGGLTALTAESLAVEYNMTIVVGYPESAEGLFFNSCLLATPGGDTANYRKIHLFSRENNLFTPGDAPPLVMDTPAGKIGLMICFDWVYPEAARLLAIGGAQVIAHPSNLVLQYCQRAMFARSVENGVFTITANRIGTENRTDRSLTFTGASQVLGPRGETLAQAPNDSETVITVEVDLSTANDKRLTEYNNLLADRRTELYGALLRKS